jgi:hypothetical protein
MATTREIRERLKDMREQLDKLSQPPEGGDPNADDVRHEGPVTLTQEAREDLQEKFAAWQPRDIYKAMAVQAIEGAKHGAGVPFDRYSTAIESLIARSKQGTPSPLVQKLLDSAGAGALIRQDLEPMVHALFVKTFPAYDAIGQKPSNGLVHAYQQVTTPGDADFIGETQVVPSHTSTFVQQTTPIAIVGSERAVSLKSQAAVDAGGMNFNLGQEELENAVTSIIRKIQETTLKGNYQVAAGTDSTVDGPYDALSFDGFRRVLEANKVLQLSGEPFLNVLRHAVREAGDNGGFPTLALLDYRVKDNLENQQIAAWRANAPQVEVAPGLRVNAINTPVGELGLVGVPGRFFGPTAGYDDGGGNLVVDVYTLDTSRVSYVYLGSPGITVIELPTAVSGALTRQFIAFSMIGLEVAAPSFCAKAQILVSELDTGT